MSAPADPAELLAAVDREVVEFEQHCELLERHLVAGEWSVASDCLQDGRRTTHAFLNAMDAAREARTEDFDQAVYTRMRRVFDIRDDQLARLQAFHDGLGERLQAVSRWKGYARAVGAKAKPPARGVALDRTQ